MHSQPTDQQLQLAGSAAPDVPPVRGDRKRLIQILTNLHGNAVKFTPPGGQGTISAQVAPGQVVVQVADTGEGIPLHAEARIFDGFYQVEGRRGAPDGGTGL